MGLFWSSASPSWLHKRQFRRRNADIQLITPCLIATCSFPPSAQKHHWTIGRAENSTQSTRLTLKETEFYEATVLPPHWLFFIIGFRPLPPESSGFCRWKFRLLRGRRGGHGSAVNPHGPEMENNLQPRRTGQKQENSIFFPHFFQKKKT